MRFFKQNSDLWIRDIEHSLNYFLISQPKHMSLDIWFPAMWYVRPAKAQTSLRIRADLLEPLLVAWIFWLLGYWPNIIWSFKLKSWLQRLVWVYTCQNATLSVITCRGSFMFILIDQIIIAIARPNCLYTSDVKY